MTDTFASESGSYNSSTLTAFFDERDDAEDAVSRLREIGVSDASIRLVGGGETTARSASYEEKGFWDSVVDFFMPDEDRYTYAEGLRRGGHLVTVSGLTAAQYDEALEILDDEGSVDLEERAASWRSEGWKGYESDVSETDMASDYVPGGSTVGASDDLSLGSTDRMASTASTAFPGDRAAMRDVGDEEVIPVVQEQLRVGKRDVNLGRVRVRSYVVEEPVSEDVHLHDERVHVERRPVDRTLTGSEAAFTDRTIEAEEHTEEAVISKDARVTEEIALRRESKDRTETVSDTVRRTEVEVEDDRSGLTEDRTVNKR